MKKRANISPEGQPSSKSANKELSDVMIYETLRKDIRSGIIPPGERLIEARLAERFNCTRHRIREAIKKLESSGIISITPNKGARVIEPTIRDIETTYQLQSALEGLACFLSTPKIKTEEINRLLTLNQEMEETTDADEWLKLNVSFHRVFIERAGNDKIIEIIRGLEFFARYWFMLFSIPGNRLKNVDDHRKIIAAVKDRDPEAAKALMEKHILRSANEVTSLLKSLPKK